MSATKSVEELARSLINERTEAALSKFRDAVRPIYGATYNGRPEHIGSAILLELPEGKFILTAAHVLDQNESTTLYLGGDDLFCLEVEAFSTRAPDEDRSLDHADFAMAKLSDAQLEKLVAAKFISEREIDTSTATEDDRTLYTCIGYPNSKNKYKPNQGNRITPELLPYTSMNRSADLLPGVADAQLHVLVDYDDKYQRDETGTKLNAIALTGCSGGAIISHGKPTLDALIEAPEPKLAALLIEAHTEEKVILGTRLCMILSIMRGNLK